MRTVLAVGRAPLARFERRVEPALAVRPLLVVVVAKCALNFAFADRYGWQRDELYYAVAGKTYRAATSSSHQ